MNAEEVKAAIEKTGSIAKAEKLLGKGRTSIQWWLARNGYRVVKKATIEKVKESNNG